MRMNSRASDLLRIVAAACLTIVTPTATIAADSSPWDKNLESAARLIAARAWIAPDGHIARAGVEIKLNPGWKTYWRYPGDSGVPPVLDFSQSENVKAVTTLFPAPVHFADGGGGHSIGYKDGVILPLHIVPLDVAKAVTLRLELDYAVCEKVCIPVHAQLQLVLTGGDSAQDSAVSAAEARVPKLVKIGGRAPLSIRIARREVVAGKPRVIADVAAPPGVPVTLFAEGPTPDWALPLPDPIAGAPDGLQRFAFVLDGLPPGAGPDGAVLRLTAVAGEQAVEALFRLD
jgi:DsbC/DsbD-like thiol-disulfide interchange protein